MVYIWLEVGSWRLEVYYYAFNNFPLPSSDFPPLISIIS